MLYMAVFYILHSMYTCDTYGQCNSRIFIFGTIIYILLWVWFTYLSITNKISSEYLDTIKACLLILFFADISVMAWLYKDFFNENSYFQMITNLLFKKKHKYIQKKNLNKLSNKLLNKKTTVDESSNKSINISNDDKENGDKENDNKENDNKENGDKENDNKENDDINNDDINNDDINNDDINNDDKENSKTILDSIKELKNNIMNTIINDTIKEDSNNDTIKDDKDDDKTNKSKSESKIYMNKEIETLNDLTSKMIY